MYENLLFLDNQSLYWYTTRNNSLCTDYNKPPYKRFKTIKENIDCRKAFTYIWINLKVYPPAYFSQKFNKISNKSGTLRWYSWKLKDNLERVNDSNFPNGCFLEQSGEFKEVWPIWTVKWNSHPNGSKNPLAQQICKKGNTLNLIFNLYTFSKLRNNIHIDGLKPLNGLIYLYKYSRHSAQNVLWLFW